MSKAGMLVAQFSTEDGIGAAAIRYFSDSAISHVDLVIPRGIALQFGHPIQTATGLLGARMGGGVRLRAPNYAKFTRTIVKGCVVPDLHAAYVFAFGQIGKPYDKRAILDFFLHRHRNFTPMERSWFCDEFAYTAYWQGGKLLLGSGNPLRLTPQEMLLSPDLLTQQGG